MRLNGGLEAVDPLALLAASNRIEHRTLVNHRRNLLVAVEPALQLRVQILHRPFTDSGDAHADFVQGADELPLILRKGRLDKKHVHDRSRVRFRQGFSPVILP